MEDRRRTVFFLPGQQVIDLEHAAKSDGYGCKSSLAATLFDRYLAERAKAKAGGRPPRRKPRPAPIAG